LLALLLRQLSWQNIPLMNAAVQTGLQQQDDSDNFQQIWEEVIEHFKKQVMEGSCDSDAMARALSSEKVVAAVHTKLLLSSRQGEQKNNMISHNDLDANQLAKGGMVEGSTKDQSPPTHISSPPLLHIFPMAFDGGSDNLSNGGDDDSQHEDPHDVLAMITTHEPPEMIPLPRWWSPKKRCGNELGITITPQRDLHSVQISPVTAWLQGGGQVQILPLPS